MQTFFLTLLLLASQGILAAAGLPTKAQTALDLALRACEVKTSASVQAAAESAYKEGASAAELSAFIEQMPAQAPLVEFEKGLKDMAGLLKEGLEDREARKAAIKAVRARLNAGQTGADAGKSAKQSGSSDATLRKAQEERREETRRILGKRGAEAFPGPTPIPR